MKLYMLALQKNYILTVSITAWAVAQILKTVINLVTNRKMNFERLVGSGGMPSSHSALVCAMVVAVARSQGAGSALFGVAFILACIVMYDAMGVRNETGKQARILNRIILERLNDSDPNNKNIIDPGFKKLKELVGHTPFEVIAGAVLGLLLGYFIPMPYTALI